MPGNYTTAHHEDKIMSYWHRYYRPDLLGWKVTRISNPSDVPQKDVIWLENDPANLDPTKMFYMEYDPNLVPALKLTKDLPGVAGGDAGATFVPVSTNKSFGVKAEGGLPPLSYQWKKVSGGQTTNLTNANGYSGVTTDTLTISNYTAATHNADYFVTVTDGAGHTVDSQRVRTKVAVSLSTNLSPTATWTAGTSASLSVTVNNLTGLAPYTHEWFKNGVSQGPGTISGSGNVTSTLTKASPTAADAGEYWCVATSSNTNEPKTVESIHCVVTVNPAA
ncbi:hypothetical protein ABR33_05985 [Enterobacter bugandensis]|nr:hypothetical protein ABR33_05985 [Enterobacter bugandensis]